jgi:hypothetical protein
VTSARRPKSPWYTASRRAQEAWKRTTTSLADGAREVGTCWTGPRGRERELGPFPICLPASYATLNLLPSIRQKALRLFEEHNIEWHMGTPAAEGLLPSTHLLDSQVQCVNVLLSLAQESHLLEVVREAVDDAVALVDIDGDGPVTFEWNGRQDYLGEWLWDTPRRRGTGSTNADALVIAERADGGRTGVVVEWKFTETYPTPVPFFRRSGSDRRDTYRPMYEGERSPFAERPELSAFFQEPHYQLLRQALLAAAMVDSGEFGIDRAVLLHLVPRANRTLRRTVPNGLSVLGDEIDLVWRRLLPGPRVRYACLDTAPLLGQTPELAERYELPTRTDLHR